MIIIPEIENNQTITSQEITDLIDTNEDSNEMNKDFENKKTKKICLRKIVE